MAGHTLLAAAGLAELTAEESRELERALLLFLSTPFLLYCLCAFALLVFLFRKPARRRQLNVRSVLAILALLVSVGLVLLVPTFPFWPAVLGG